MKRPSSFHFVLALIALLGAAPAASPPAGAKSKPAAASKTTATEEQATQANPGPWGKIEYSYFYLEAPEHLVSTVQAPSSTPRWVFTGTTAEALRALFVRAGLPADMQDRWLDPKHLLVEGGTLTIFPDPRDLENITPEMRAVIYPEVAKSPANEFYQNPIYFTGDGVEEWLRDAKLRPELQAVIRSMSYPLGQVQAFSNIAVLLRHAQSDAEVRRLVKVTTRVRCLIANLRIDPGDDIKALAAYWAGHDDQSDILPLLKSVGERTGGSAKLDLTHLLPPLARQLLYTYPSLVNARDGRLPDCHWTTLNFFNTTPQQYYRDTRLAAKRILEAYTPVAPPYRFGDALLFLDKEGNAIHSCTYIADDIVFTKNGENALQPWVLKKIAGVQQIYLRTDDERMQGYRLKPGA